MANSAGELTQPRTGLRLAGYRRIVAVKQLVRSKLGLCGLLISAIIVVLVSGRARQVPAHRCPGPGEHPGVQALALVLRFLYGAVDGLRHGRAIDLDLVEGRV